MPQTTSPQGNGRQLSVREQAEEVKSHLERMGDQFKAALPSHITPEKFQRTVMTALNLNPDLLRCDRRSLFNAASKAASDGLLPDGREGALVPFKGQVAWMPMVSGIIKKARQSGEISSLGARIVYEAEIAQGRFAHRVVDGIPKVDHEPILWGERGKPVLVYSFVQFKDGTTDFEFLHADDVAKMRAMSRAKSGPWHDWPEEMWKKSAIRRHAKRLPISSELFDAISSDDEMTEFQRQRQDAEVKMLRAASAQLGAPEVSPSAEGGIEAIDGESALYTDPPSTDVDDTMLIYLDTQLGELRGAKSERVKAEIHEAVEDTIAGSIERGEMTEQEADAARAKWREMSAAAGGMVAA